MPRTWKNDLTLIHNTRALAARRPTGWNLILLPWALWAVGALFILYVVWLLANHNVY